MDRLQRLCAFDALPLKVSFHRRNDVAVTPTSGGDVPTRGRSHLLVLLMAALLVLGLAPSPARA